MSCSDVLELIEPIAAGDLRADEAVRAHLQSCVTCAAALASAQRLEVSPERDGDSAGAGRRSRRRCCSASAAIAGSPSRTSTGSSTWRSLPPSS